MSEWRFGLLGPVEFSSPRGPVEVRGARRRALLVRLLVAANRAVSADVLIDDLWEGAARPAVTSTLQSHVSLLRRSLGDRLVGGQAGYCVVVADGELDVDLFEGDVLRGSVALAAGEPGEALAVLDRALGRWRGAALADVGEAHWAVGEIARLNELRVAAIECRFDAVLGVGGHHQLAGAIEAMLVEYPLRERLWGQLMLALYRSGRQAEALRAFQRLRGVLGGQLGIEPSAELVALDDAIVQHKPFLDWQRTPALAALAIDLVAAGRQDRSDLNVDRAWILDSSLSVVRGEPRRLASGSEPTRAEFALNAGRSTNRRPWHRPLAAPERDGFVLGAMHRQAAETGNLPRVLSRVFGRDDETVQIGAALAGSWLVSLVGTGGVGKTTLALVAAGAAATGYPDGVWWFELASVRSGVDLVHTVAAVLGVRENAEQPLLDTLCEAVGQRCVLLVLDNCEHLVADVASIVGTLGRRCPALRVLATSRERLAVPGERLVWVRPLAAGTANDPAMDLLLDRMDRPDVAEDPVEAAALLEICRRLQGLPLALELAGARCISLLPSDVAARLGANTGLLSDSRRSDQRQRTLEATVRWSFELLDEPERMVFERVAVFIGGFTLDAAEAVCEGDGLDQPTIDEAVASLVAKSLVDSDGPRFRMLETTREFALGALDRRGDTARIQRRHVAFFVAFVQRCRLGLRGGDESRWAEVLSVEWANVRAAFRLSVDQADLVAATTIVAHLWLEALLRRPEAQAWCRELAGRFDGQDHPLRHELLGATAVAEWALGNLERGVELGIAAVTTDPAPGTATDRLPETGACVNLMWSGRFGESVAISARVVEAAHADGNTWDELMFLTYLAYATAVVAGVDDAIRSARRAATLADAMGSSSGRMWTSLVLARLLSDSRAALELVDEALELAHATGNDWIESQLTLERARRLSRIGETTEALRCVEACAVELQHQGRFLHAWRALIIAAEVHTELGNHAVAASLYGASRSSPAAPTHAADLAQIESNLTSALSSEQLADLVDNGARFTLPAALQLLVDASQITG